MNALLDGNTVNRYLSLTARSKSDKTRMHSGPYENENYNQNNQLRSINNQTLKKHEQNVAFFVDKRKLKTSLSKRLKTL